jgi:hypothetical protein
LQHAGQPTLTAKAEAEAEAEAELEPLVTVFAFEGSKRVPTTADLATPPHVHSPRGSGLPMGSGTEPAQQVGSAQPAYNRSGATAYLESTAASVGLLTVRRN